MGRLYVVPTPIGNLEDITLRALRVLQDVSLILAEDTRHSRKLLNHYGISTPLQSYHQHNKRSRLEWALGEVRERDIALVSSAGTPSIADPGFELMRAMREAGIEVDVLPGPNAVVTAVVAAALPAPGFVFAGFLPRSMSERRRKLADLARLPYSIALYEAPHRLVSCLRDVFLILGNREVVLARELTKLHQEVSHTTVASSIERYTAEEPRGEFTIVVAGAPPSDQDVSLQVQEDVKLRRLRGESARTVTAELSAKYGLPRNEIYDIWIESAQ